MASKEILERPFQPNEIKNDVKRHTDGFEPVYVEAASVIRRLNEAFGQGSWRHEIVGEPVFFPPVQSGQPPTQIIVRVKLTCDFNDHTGQIRVSQHEQFGSCYLKTNQRGFVDPGSDYKAAVTDGLKKCATYLGIALDLYVKDESPMQGLHRKDAIAQQGNFPSTQVNPNAPAQQFQVDEVRKMFEKLGIGDPAWWQALQLRGPELTQGQVAQLLSGQHPWVAQLHAQQGKQPGLVPSAA